MQSEGISWRALRVADGVVIVAGGVAALLIILHSCHWAARDLSWLVYLSNSMFFLGLGLLTWLTSSAKETSSIHISWFVTILAIVLYYTWSIYDELVLHGGGGKVEAGLVWAPVMMLLFLLPLCFLVILAITSVVHFIRSDGAW
jgi:hypothetical protein